MVASELRAPVLLFTCGAERELIHCCSVPVIRKRADNTVPRATIDTGCCPITRITPTNTLNVPDTGITDGNIRWNHAGEIPGPALHNNKTVRNHSFKWKDDYFVYDRQGRTFSDLSEKILETIPFCMNYYLTPEVGNRSTDLEGVCTCVDEGAKPDTLYDPTDDDSARSPHRYQQRL
jgi:hypothetical protein